MTNLGFLSLDILILFVIFFVLFFYSMKTSKKVLVSLICSTYPALIIFNNFPYVDFEPGMAEAIAFAVIYLIINTVLLKYLSKKNLHTPGRKFVDYSLLTISYMALIISISSKSVTSLQNLYTFTGLIPDLVNQLDFGLMLIIPLVVLFLTSKGDA